MTARAASDYLIVALDGTPKQATGWAREVSGSAGWLKVGMTLYYQMGPRIVDELHRMGPKVFLDLKLHDIPHQVEGAAYVLGRLGVEMLTVHALGGAKMVEAAVRGAARGAEEIGQSPADVVAVTILTSMTAGNLESIGVEVPIADEVMRLAHLAVEAGASGIVCSAQESARIRDEFGEGIAIVTPGIRPSWASADDQQRIATPATAIADGSTHLVVGRPITENASPAEAASKVRTEIEEALR